jgi:tetratricopeptide (TPR) repeat protein
MSEVGPFAGLPGDLQALLIAAPSTDKSLLELQVSWGGLSPELARMADALRVFVVSWDPLEWLGAGALGDACARLERPHLPNGLLGRLAGAEEIMFTKAEPDRLAAWAVALIEAAGWFPGRDEDLAMALGAEPDMPWLPEWTLNMVLDLGRVGLGELAAEVGAALAAVDVANASVYAADVGVALAEAGRGEAAREKIAENVAAWPDDFWVRVHAGDALMELDDFDGAEAHIVAALGMADDADDFLSLSDANERLDELRRRRRKAQKAARQPTPTARTAPGDPCPCGSGTKFKHCHGRQRRR